jgi:alpha-L-rhamnosidase
LINDFAYVRKEFRIRETPVSARLFVTAHHYVHVYIDGVKIGGYGTPAPTDPAKRKYYTEYEIRRHMTEGFHCLTADAHYLGGGGQNAADGLPGIRLELHLIYADGRKELIKTDSSWTALVDMPHRTGTPYQQNRRISAVEDYDAGRWDPAWRKPHWQGTLAFSPVAIVNAHREHWRLCPQPIPEGEIHEELVPVKLELPVHPGAGDHPQVFDAGRIVSGWPKLRLKGIKGTTVRMRYSEDLDGSGRVKHNVCNERSDYYYDQYTMRGDEIEEWQPAFSYKAFRYIEITGYPEPIEPGSGLIVCWAYTGMRQTGSFNCSDDHLNKLYAMCMRTQKNNVLGQVVDCPHREQAQYLADADLQAQALLYNFDASAAILAKTLMDFADAQLEDGTFPFNAPSNYHHPQFHIQIPEWDLHFATLLWTLYDATGDLQVLTTFYKPLCSMIDYYMSKRDPKWGLIPLDKGWHISDWPYPSVEHRGEFLTVQQIKALQALRIAVKAAAAIGRNSDAQRYQGLAKQLMRNVNKHLFVAKLAAYRDSIDSQQTHQGVTALAIAANIVPGNLRKKAIDFVAACEWECRTVLSLPLLRVLFECGRQQEAFDIINRREFPGWGYMIAQGAQTLWEGWEDRDSHSHAWNGYPARLLQEYVAGIRSAAPGFRKAVIQPFFPDSLSFAEATVHTPHGSLAAGWERTMTGNIRIQATIPPGIEAILKVQWNGKSVHRKLAHGKNDIAIMHRP